MRRQHEPDIFSLLLEAFTPAEGAIVALVDRLLDACRGRCVRLTHGPAGCQVGWSGHAGTPGPLDTSEPLPPSSFVGGAVFPLPRPAFRSLLARIAALCNRRSPGSVSPYGGAGLLVSDTGFVFRAVFKITKEALALDLLHIGDPAAFAEPEAAIDSDCSALPPLRETPAAGRRVGPAGPAVGEV